MFKRLPFGLSSSQDVFQSIMTEDIDGVEVIVDDLLIWGENVSQHDARLKRVLDQAKQRNLKLNREKSQIKLTEISYIGHILSKDGVRPDPKKVEAIEYTEGQGRAAKVFGYGHLPFQIHTEHIANSSST